jgi:hypothetical protein
MKKSRKLKEFKSWLLIICVSKCDSGLYYFWAFDLRELDSFEEIFAPGSGGVFEMKRTCG